MVVFIHNTNFLATNSGNFKGSAVGKGYSGSTGSDECYKMCIFMRYTDSCGL